MIGMVLWSDPADRKAVFWCEDHGDLAYYDGSVAGLLDQNALSAGDMVEFDVVLCGKIRRAERAHLVKSSVCNGLQDHLRKSAKPQEEVATRHFSDNVVDFLPPLSQRQRA